MNKLVYFIVLILLCTLLASCNGEENQNQSAPESNVVSTTSNTESTTDDEGAGTMSSSSTTAVSTEKTSAHQTTAMATSTIQKTQATSVKPKASLDCVAPKNGAKVNVTNSTVQDWYTNYFPKTSLDYFGGGDQYIPSPLVLKWSDVGAQRYIVSISLTKDMKNAVSYETTACSYSVDGLFVDQMYFWQVKAVFEKDTQTSAVFSFVTNPGIRTIRLDGVSNTRDIGGKKTASGKTLRQGMLYRGEAADNIKNSGLALQNSIYKIKTDIDFRREDEVRLAVSPLGDDLGYIHVSFPIYSAIFEKENYEAVRKAFSALANPNNYPIYAHCAIGRDRTGMFCALLEGLLGVGTEDIYRDYECSFLSHSGSSYYSSPDKTLYEHLMKTFATLLEDINKFGTGSTFAEHVEDYLLTTGVTKAEIESIRSILLV